MRLSLPPFLIRVGNAFGALYRDTVYRITSIVLLAAMIGASLILWQYWTSISKDAQSRGSTLAYLLAEQTTRTFQAVDLTLAGLDAVFKATPRPPHAPGFESLLKQRVEELDFIQALYVVDASGRVMQSSGAVEDVVSTLSARRYFETFANNPKLRFMIGQPLLNRPGMLSAVPAMRRLDLDGGRFGGMIVASIEPRYFRDFYRNVDLGRRGSIDLYQDNGGILLASTGDSGAAMMPPLIVSTPMFDVDAQLGLFQSTSPASDRQLVAYHRAQGYPLVVAVGIDLRDLRSRWWRIAWPTLGAMGVTVVLGIALAVLISRRLEERRHAQNRAMMMQKLEALGQMTASVSHDFRNLLAVMRSTLQLVRKKGPTEQILSAAEEAIDRGSGLVTQLLAFSRRHALEVAPADLNALLSGLGQVLTHAAGPGVALRIDTAVGLPVCLTDQTQFDAAMMNLVVNARQAMPDGGSVSISTRIAASRPGSVPAFVELQVTDTGHGIPPADLRRIFEPFFTTKAETGTGLGLSQVYGFMRQIGGDVTVSSTVGKGTTFTLLFPVVPAAAPRPADTTRPDPEPAIPASGRQESFATLK